MGKQVNFKDVVINAIGSEISIGSEIIVGSQLLIECEENEYSLIAYMDSSNQYWKRIEILDIANNTVIGYDISENSKEYSLRAIALKAGNVLNSCIFENFILIEMAKLLGEFEVNSSIRNLKYFISDIMGGCWHYNVDIVNIEYYNEIDTNKHMQLDNNKFIGNNMEIIEKIDSTYRITHLDAEITSVLCKLFKGSIYNKKDNYEQLFKLVNSIRERNKHKIVFN